MLFGKDRHELAEGNAVYFDCTVPHAYRRRGPKRSTAIVVALDIRVRRRTAAVVLYDFGAIGSWSSCISPTSGCDPVIHPFDKLV